MDFYRVKHTVNVPFDQVVMKTTDTQEASQRQYCSSIDTQISLVDEVFEIILT